MVSNGNGRIGRWMGDWRSHWIAGAGYFLGVGASAKKINDWPDDIKLAATAVLVGLPLIMPALLKRSSRLLFGFRKVDQTQKEGVQPKSENGNGARMKAGDREIFRTTTTLTLGTVVAAAFFLAVLWIDGVVTKLALYQLLINILMLSVIVIAVVQLRYARRQLEQAERQGNIVEELRIGTERLREAVSVLGRKLLEAFEDVSRNVATLSENAHDALPRARDDVADDGPEGTSLRTGHGQRGTVVGSPAPRLREFRWWAGTLVGLLGVIVLAIVLQTLGVIPFLGKE